MSVVEEARPIATEGGGTGNLDSETGSDVEPQKVPLEWVWQ